MRCDVLWVEGNIISLVQSGKLVQQRIHVVAAILNNAEGILACRRSPNKTSGGLWEFPGGKVEPGESSFDALVREIREELSIEVRPLRVFDRSISKVGELEIELECITCEPIYPKQISSFDHDMVKWLALSDLNSVEWAIPDIPAVEKAMKLSGLEDLYHFVGRRQ